MDFTTIMQTVTKNDIRIPMVRGKSKFQLFQKIMRMCDSNKKTELINTFCNAQKVFHILTKYIRIKKTRDSGIENDLLYNELSTYKEHLKITFNHNNTQYTFLLRDLHKLWKTALETNENMIPTPLALKNPYDNIEFSKHTLYNIYFTMLFSGLHIDPLIHYFFKVNFVLNKFADDNYVRLYEISLQDYTEQTLTINYNMYSFLKSIKIGYPQHTKNIYVHDDLPSYIKKYCVDKMKSVLKYYCMYSFAIDISSLHSKIENYERKFIHELSKVNKQIFCRPYLVREKHDETDINSRRVTNKYYYFEKDNVIY
tara:strand:- start:550 stop:1485 length:936 start_codon:yes stop_codon:yes gene_type:complete